MNSSVHEHVQCHQTTKFHAREIKWFYSKSLALVNTGKLVIGGRIAELKPNIKYSIIHKNQTFVSSCHCYIAVKDQMFKKGSLLYSENTYTF